jgi:hypothetical protein
MSPILADPQEVFGRSFMYTRPAYYHLATHQALWHDIAYNKRGPQYGALQLIAFYMQSIDLKKSARYFLPACQNELLVSGDQNTEDQKIRDVRAEWLNLDSNFRGFMSINPEQRKFGFSIEYNQDLKQVINSDLFRHHWISIEVPVVGVENNLNLTQNNARTSTNSPKNIIEAFNQREWRYSKIDGQRNKVRLAEIRFCIGSSLVSEDYFQMAYKSILVAPAGNKQNPEFMFDPVVGNNHHPGVGGAIFFQFPLNRDTTKQAICFFANLEALLLIRNKQFRTFDLKDKPWSRFMLYNLADCSASNVPGVNLLTLESIVRPFGTVDCSLGWRYKSEWIEAEVGYNIWGRGDERVKLRSAFNNPCQCDAFGIAGSQPGRSASKSTIKQQSDDDQEIQTVGIVNGVEQKGFVNVFVPIKESDIDLRSGSAESALQHKVHFSFGAIHKSDRADGLLGGGIFVGIPQKNSTLKMWGAWVKLGASF